MRIRKQSSISDEDEHRPSTSVKAKDEKTESTSKRSYQVPKDGRAFLFLWFGQFISLIGTDITKFALRVWTYQGTTWLYNYFRLRRKFI